MDRIFGGGQNCDVLPSLQLQLNSTQLNSISTRLNSTHSSRHPPAQSWWADPLLAESCTEEAEKKEKNKEEKNRERERIYLMQEGLLASGGGANDGGWSVEEEGGYGTARGSTRDHDDGVESDEEGSSGNRAVECCRLWMPCFSSYTPLGFATMLLHLLLIVMSSYQLLQWNTQDGSYYRATGRTWLYWFMPDDYDFALGPHQYHLYTYKATTESVKRVVHNYFHINSKAVDNFQYFCEPGQVGSPEGNSSTSGCKVGTMVERPTLYFTSYHTSVEDMFHFDSSSASVEAKVETFKLSEDNLGPFDLSRYTESMVANNITRMTTAMIKFRLQGFLFGSSYRSCIVWDVSVFYDFRSRGHISQTVFADVPGSCDIVVDKSTSKNNDKDKGKGKNDTRMPTLGDGIWLNVPMCICAILYGFCTSFDCTGSVR